MKMPETHGNSLPSNTNLNCANREFPAREPGGPRAAMLKCECGCDCEWDLMKWDISLGKLYMLV